MCKRKQVGVVAGIQIVRLLTIWPSERHPSDGGTTGMSKKRSADDVTSARL